MVTSLHDGMNLVAKEFVSVRDDGDGVLILSRFTGAARELRDALLVNPYDVDEMAEAIRRAVEMPSGERRSRMARMGQMVREHNIYRWAGRLLGELAAAALQGRPRRHRGEADPARDAGACRRRRTLRILGRRELAPERRAAGAHLAGRSAVFHLLDERPERGGADASLRRPRRELGENRLAPGRLEVKLEERVARGETEPLRAW